MTSRQKVSPIFDEVDGSASDKTACHKPSRSNFFRVRPWWHGQESSSEPKEERDWETERMYVDSLRVRVPPASSSSEKPEITFQRTKNADDYINSFDYNPFLEDEVQRVVRFDEMVTVVTIESHRDYPKNVNDQIYTSAEEMRTNLRRNIYEFNADGRDWRRALEEDAMILTSNGEYIHPVHVIGLTSYLQKRALLCAQWNHCLNDSVLRNS